MLSVVCGSTFKGLRRCYQELLFPSAYHLRGELMLTAQLRHTSLACQQLQYHLTLELWGKLPSLVHVTYPFLRL